MANATVRFVEKMVPTQVKGGVMLELSMPEARAISAVLGRIGDPYGLLGETSARKHTQNVYSALRDAGIYCKAEIGIHVEHGMNAIFFLPGSLALVEGEDK